MSTLIEGKPETGTVMWPGLFAGWTDSDLRRLEQMGNKRRFEPHTYVFRAGSPPDSVYILRAGLVQLSVPVGASAPVAHQVVTPGNLFGAIGTICGKTYLYDAQALTPTNVLCVTREPFLALLRKHPETSLQLSCMFAAELNGAYERLRASRVNGRSVHS